MNGKEFQQLSGLPGDTSPSEFHMLFMATLAICATQQGMSPEEAWHVVELHWKSGNEVVLTWLRRMFERLASVYAQLNDLGGWASKIEGVLDETLQAPGPGVVAQAEREGTSCRAAPA